MLKRASEPLLGTRVKSKLSDRDKLLNQLKEQEYYRLLNRPAQLDLINWFQKRIDQAGDLDSQLSLKGTKQRMTTKRWLELLIIDQHTPLEQAEIDALKFEEKQVSQFRKGKFNEARFELASRITRGLGLINDSAQVFAEDSWQNTIGIDALLDFEQAGKAWTMPVQIKSSAHKVAKFFTKPINYKGQQVRRKNILALDISNFSISQLINLFKSIVEADEKICSEIPQSKGKGHRMVEIVAKSLSPQITQKGKLLKSEGFQRKGAEAQENLVARQYLQQEPKPSQRK
ncbi:MAG: hypothetical protein OXU45_05345 [Candidatus Melainabacteria bacterium]|nr:hypothetical protein [Candidatus Melainabacteria bacterium]